MNRFNLSFIAFLLLLFAGPGCVATANLSDLPASAENIDFSKLPAAKIDATDKSWNKRTTFEYYVKTNTTDEEQVAVVIKSALAKDGFRIVASGGGSRSILAERPARANEWKTVIGAYYKPGAEGHEIYIKAKITQDITGGWREDRAKNLADAICNSLNNCTASYSVKLN